FAESRHHADLTFLHDEKPAGKPQQHAPDDDCRQADTGATWRRMEPAAAVARASWPSERVAALGFATEQRSQAIIEIAPEIVEIGRTIAPLGLAWRLAVT